MGRNTVVTDDIRPEAVTLATMADLAANSIIGNNTGSPATPLALTIAQVLALGGLATNVTAGKTLTLAATDNYTLTIPATLTAAGLGIANQFTAQQTITAGIDANFGQLKLVSTGRYGGLSIFGDTSSADNRNWQIQNNYFLAGNLDFLYSTTNSGNPLTLAMSISKSGNLLVGATGYLFPNNGKLVVVSTGGTSTGIALRLTVDGAGSYAPIDFYSTGGLVGQFLCTAPSYSNAGLAGNEIILFSELATGALHLGAGGASGAIRFTTGGYATTNERMRIISTGWIGYGITAPLAFSHLRDNTTVTNAIREVQRIEAVVSTAATGGAAGFGPGLSLYAETATDGTSQQQALIASVWVDATNATRKAKLQLSAYDTAARLGLEIEASGSLPLVRVFSAVNYAAITPTVVAGDLYNDSGQAKHGSFTNGLEGWFERCIWSGYAEVTHTGVVTAQSMFTGTAKGTRTLPANFWKQGKAIRVRLQGHYTTDAAAGNATIDIKFGATTFRTTGSFGLDNSVTDGFWALEFAIVCETTGATGTVNGTISWVHSQITGGSTPVHATPMTTHTPVTLDTTASQVFDVLWTADDAGTVFHVDTARVWEVC